MAHFDCNRGAVHVGLSAAYAPDSIWVAGDTKNKFSGRKVAVTAVAAVTTRPRNAPDCSGYIAHPKTPRIHPTTPLNTAFLVQYGDVFG